MMPTDLSALERRASYHYSDRLCMRPVALTDAWPLWQATRDDRFNTHLLWEQPGRELDVFERVEHMHELARRNEVLTLSCTLRESGRWAGVFRYAPLRDGLETSLWIHPDFWAVPGLATEFGRLGLHLGFAEGGAQRLYARSLTENRAVHKLMKPSGFLPIDQGTLVDEAGCSREYILYCIEPAAHQALGTQLFHHISHQSSGKRSEVEPRPHAAAPVLATTAG